MSPSFLRMFRKEDLPRHIRRTNPNAIGILDSTCEIDGDPSNEWKLPIPSPDRRTLKLGSHQCNPQRQSWLFQLPPEIRELIYIELLGGRRVHIDHAYKWPPEFRLDRTIGRNHTRYYWQWWHIVCGRGNSFLDDRAHDQCPNYVGEYNDTKESGWKVAPRGTKIEGVNLLQCCQLSHKEGVQILYGTNVFVTGEVLDTPSHMSRILQPNYTSLIKSMDLWIGLGAPNCEPPGLTGTWATVYPALIELFNHSFRNVTQLRLTMHLKPAGSIPITMTGENKDKLLAPLETLAKSREWSRLELRIQKDWYEALQCWAETQDFWALTVMESTVRRMSTHCPVPPF